MNQMFDRLNLRPGEKRLLVVVLAVAFLVLNLLFVWPHFKDWNKTQTTLKAAREKLAAYEAEIARQAYYEAEIQKLTAGGSDVATEEQAINLISTVQSKARRFNVNFTSIRPVTRGRLVNTNEFFDEQAVAINIDTGDEELVRFLFDLSSSESLIRVRDLDLKPDRTGTRLQGSMTLVASYPKNSSGASATKSNSE